MPAEAVRRISQSASNRSIRPSFAKGAGTYALHGWRNSDGVCPSNLGLGAELEGWNKLQAGQQDLRFSLSQISRTSDAWKKLTSVPKFEKRVRVSLCLKAGATDLELPTSVDPNHAFEFALLSEFPPSASPSQHCFSLSWSGC